MDRCKERKKLRQQRRALSLQQQHQAAFQLRARLKHLCGFMSAHYVGVYLANDGEINPNLVTQWLWQAGKDAYLPLLMGRSGSAMRFGEYHSDSIFRHNQYGILEPICHRSQIFRASSLDAILLPLVAFDHKGNRLGMGGGYYDRALAFRQRQTYTRRPKLIGIGHHFQQLASLETQAWDVPLDALVTDQETYFF